MNVSRTLDDVSLSILPLIFFGIGLHLAICVILKSESASIYFSKR